MTETKNNYVEGFPLKAEEVKQAKEKTFEILKEPVYEVFEDQETKQVKRRLKMVILFEKISVKYYPNKTSQSKIIIKKGRNLKNWIGFKGEFETLSQKVGKNILDVIYIK